MTVHVAPDGLDTNPGTKQQPLASLTAARDAVRKMAGDGTKRIVVHEGAYWDVSLTLGPEDSGLSIEAAEGETPVLYGGKRITDWHKDGENFWSAPLGKIDGDAWEPTTLVVNGRMAKRARLPASGEFEHLSVFDVPHLKTYEAQERAEADGLPFCLWKRRPTEEELTTLEYCRGDLGEWLDINNAEISVYHMWDTSSGRLAAHDPKTRMLTFANKAANPPGAFGIRKYVLWNIRQGMSHPGQWYLDRTAGRAVYWPLPDEDMSSVEAVGSTCDTIISVKGSPEKPVRDVAISGLLLTVTNRYLGPRTFACVEAPGALEAIHVESCRVSDLEIDNVGGTGIRGRLGSDANLVARNLQIDGCHVHHCGAGGVYVTGTDCEISDCRIHDIGIILPSGMGIWAGSKNVICRHNEIYDTQHVGIGYYGEDMLVEGNRIYRVMKDLSDGAAIYGLGKRNVVRGNFVSDVFVREGYGSSAFYFDEITEDGILEGNLSVGVARPSHNHVCKNITIRNNVFVADGDLQLTFPFCKGQSLEKNVIVSGGTIDILTRLDGDATFRNNLFSCPGMVEIGWLANGYAPIKRCMLSMTMGNLKADPQFANPDGDDYTFQPDSPATGLGITPLDLSNVGPRGQKEE